MMLLWQRYGHLWPQALVVSLTVINVCWNLAILFNQTRAARGKPFVEMAASLTLSILSAVVYLALDAQRIATALRPSLTRAKVAYYLWIAERVFGAAIFAGVVALSMNDAELQKTIEESNKKQGPTPLWRMLMMFTPFILGFALWRMNRNLVYADGREQQQQYQQQRPQDALAQNAVNAAGNQRGQHPTRMRRWPAVFIIFNAVVSFGSICYGFAVMSLPVSYSDVVNSLLSLYVQAFGFLAIYRRSISSIRQYTYLLVVSGIVLDIAWVILDPPIQNPLPTPEQESQIFNLDLDSILNAKPIDPTSSFSDLLSAEMSMAEFVMTTIFTVALDIWLCQKIIQDLEKIEEAEKKASDEAQEHTRAQTQQAQMQTQAQVQAQAQRQEAATHVTTSEGTSSGLQQRRPIGTMQALHEN
ncbi:hypothetical protein MVEG_10932 [Podila verticillata NRRL 6337]|nr:hypothetical protein MVEG_10932 [Podila verticillata NRRL 6337]